jgi:hypothetical protein
MAHECLIKKGRNRCSRTDVLLEHTQSLHIPRRARRLKEMQISIKLMHYQHINLRKEIHKDFSESFTRTLTIVRWQKRVDRDLEETDQRW